MTLPPEPTPQVVAITSTSSSQLEEIIIRLFGEQINSLHQKIQELSDRLSVIENPNQQS